MSWIPKYFCLLVHIFVSMPAIKADIGNPCDVNAEMHMIGGIVECFCKQGFYGTGETCTDIDECRNDCACPKDTTCRNHEGSYECVEELAENPCDANAEMHIIGGIIECFCKRGFYGTGKNCTDIDECINDCQCPNKICQNYDGFYECVEESEICAALACDVNAVCASLNGTYRCSCNKGFSGNGTLCSDDNECTLDSHKCHVNATCQNTVGSFNCTCNDGYSGDGAACEDIDECTVGNHSCDDNATCKNLNGSYLCNCNEGYFKDKLTCTDIDECDLDTDNCNESALCHNIAGSFNCTCKNGYSGNGVTCEDIDECVSDTDDCDDNAACANSVGSFECTCNSGYSGNGVTCQNIDECSAATDNCHIAATCSDNDGSFDCLCNSGYSGDGINCQDIDECVFDTDDCDENAACTNSVGSFECTCNSGYSGNGVACQNINECSSATDNCHNAATCSDNDGSFDCTCNSGYSGDGINCQDIDECSEGTNNCHEHALCTNTDGSFDCTCVSGYTGSGQDCQDIDECSGVHNCSSVATCNNQNGTYDCTCNDGYTGDGKECVDIDECNATPAQCAADGQRCANYPGGYRCTCTSPRQQLTDDESGCIDVAATFLGNIRIINRLYINAYNDTNSPEYLITVEEIEAKLTIALRATGSTVSAYFVAIKIINLYPGSINVDYVTTFNATNGLSNSVVQQELANTLIVKNNGTFIDDLQISVNTDPERGQDALVFRDYDECNPSDVIHVPDCGSNTTCVNTNTSYECVCLEGFVKNGSTGCTVSVIENQVDKSLVNDVEYLVIGILVWLAICFSIAALMVVVAVVIFFTGNTNYMYPVKYGTAGNIKPRRITSPKFAGHPTLDRYYTKSRYVL